MASASSGERTHSAVGPRAARSAATVVPHEPAPTTATTPCDMKRAYGSFPVAPSEPTAVWPTEVTRTLGR